MKHKLNAEDYLQGFHNAHHHLEEDTTTPEWYELAEAGYPMKGIGLPSFRRGGPVEGDVSHALALTGRYMMRPKRS